MSARIRTLHVGLGPIGEAILGRAAASTRLEPVGALDASSALIGRSVAGLLIEGPGQRHPGDYEAAVAVLATTSRAALFCDQVRPFLEAGMHVITTCEELSYPWRRHPEAWSIDELARRARRSVLATGVNPGFVMDFLPLVYATLAHRVTGVQVRRFQDAGRRRLPFQLKVGVGLDRKEFEEKAAAGGFGHVGLGESADMIAAGLGWTVIRDAERVEPVLAAAETRWAQGTIGPQGVVGMDQLMEVECDLGSITLHMRMSLGGEDLDAVELEGDPPLSFQAPAGIHGDQATAAVAVNMASRLPGLRPGLRTMLDLLM